MNMLPTDVLVLITARGGSKGIPGKNIKPLAGKPLLYYSIDTARQLVSDSQICLSTDSDEIIAAAAAHGLPVFFKRPDELAGDTTGSYEVMLHAVSFFREQGKQYRTLVLLQPTSPFRTAGQVREAYNLLGKTDEMVWSVAESSHNPYYNLFEQNNNGYLKKCIVSNYIRRQDCPPVYEINGAIYVISIDALLEKPLSRFTKTKKYVMDELRSIDIDTPTDWLWAEFLLQQNIVNL